MKKIIWVAGLIAFSDVALAHTGLLPTDGFVHGFQHPFLGLDHFLVMLGLGLWASSQSRLLARQAMGVFLLFMIVGALFGLAGLGFAYVETGILASLVLVGVVLSFPIAPTLRRYSYLYVGRNKSIQARSARWRFRKIWLAFAGNAGSCYRSNRLIPAYFPLLSEGTIKAIMLAPIAFFAAMHGLAHGSALPLDASAYAYIAGFVSATAVLLVSGLALGWIAQRINAAGLIHIYGTMTGLIGAWLLLA